jgi:hypothetical protein
MKEEGNNKNQLLEFLGINVAMERHEFKSCASFWLYLALVKQVWRVVVWTLFESAKITRKTN